MNVRNCPVSLKTQRETIRKTKNRTKKNLTKRKKQRTNERKSGEEGNHKMGKGKERKFLFFRHQDVTRWWKVVRVNRIIYEREAEILFLFSAQITDFCNETRIFISRSNPSAHVLAYMITWKMIHRRNNNNTNNNNNIVSIRMYVRNYIVHIWKIEPSRMQEKREMVYIKQ